MEFNKYKKKYELRHKLAALTAVLITACVVVLVAWRMLGHPTSRELHHLSTRADSYPVSNTLRKGNLNGTYFAIPSNYLEYPVEYLDTSIWGAKEPEINYENRTYDDAIQEFTVRVHWPDFESHVAWSSRRSLESRQDRGATEWVSVSVNHGYVNAPRPPLAPDNGMARVLRGRLERLSAKRQTERPLEIRDAITGANVIVRGVYYEMRGLDPKTGLQSAVPVGPETETFHGWNNLLYWAGDMNGVVEVLISCYQGKVKIINKPDLIGKCEQHFEIPNIKAEVTLYYPSSLLPQWEELQDRSRQFILSLRHSPSHALKNVTNHHSREQ